MSLFRLFAVALAVLLANALNNKIALVSCPCCKRLFACCAMLVASLLLICV